MVKYQVVKASPHGSLHMIEPLAVASKGARHGVRQGMRQVHSLLFPLPHMVEVTLNSSMVVGTLKSSMKCYMYNIDFHDFSHHWTYSMVWKYVYFTPCLTPWQRARQSKMEWNKVILGFRVPTTCSKKKFDCYL